MAKRNRSRPGEPNETARDADAVSSGELKPRRGWRRCAFRIAVPLAVIVLAVALLEIGLRLFGYDHLLQTHPFFVHGKFSPANVDIAQNPGNILRWNLKHEQFNMIPVRLDVRQYFFNPGITKRLVFEINEYEITDQKSPNWAKAQLSVRCGYYHSPTGR